MLTLADKLWISVKTAYLRITLTRFTAAFFFFCFLQCFAQGIIQSFLYSIDYDASSLVSTILTQGQVPFKSEFAWLQRDDSTFRLQLCNHIPGGATQNPCTLLYDSSISDLNVNLTGYRKRAESAVLVAVPGSGNHGIVVSPSIDTSSGVIGGVSLTVPGGQTTVLDKQCTRTLIYPDQVLKSSRREELALIGSQFWLFVISCYAIGYDSLPHLYAALFSRIISSGWSAYSIWRTHDIKNRFEHLIINPNTPCHTDLLFPDYFSQRLAWQVPDLVLNLIALLATAILGWKLAELYGRHVFRRAGPPREIVNTYRLFLAFFVNMQLSVFFLITLMGLWIDQLMNSAISTISSHTKIYDALLIFTSICLIPWITMGWYSVSRERRRLMLIFLGVNLTFLVGWGAMFDSLVFTWTFVQWPFLGCMTVASFIFLAASLGLGILCWLKFGNGLSQWLHVDDTLASQDFEPELHETYFDKAPVAEEGWTRPLPDKGLSLTNSLAARPGGGAIVLQFPSVAYSPTERLKAGPF